MFIYVVGPSAATYGNYCDHHTSKGFTGMDTWSALVVLLVVTFECRESLGIWCENCHAWS